MAINERVGILTHFGPRVETPGLIDGVYAEFLTKEFDFLDDVRNWPQSSDFVSDPMTYIGGNDWEDLGTYFRQWRDDRSNKIRNYWFNRANRSKFDYENIVLDSNPYSNNGNGSNEFEKLRFVFPSKDGEINYPYPDTLIGADHYAYYNRRRPLMVDKVRMGMKSINDLGKLLTFQNPEILESLENQDGDSKINLSNYGFPDVGGYNIFGTLKALDGKLYVFGNDVIVQQLGNNLSRDIYRFNVDGSIDTSFDINLYGNTFIKSIEIQSDGKIIIAGKFDSVNGVEAHDIVRLNVDGTLDNSFSRSRLFYVSNDVNDNNQNVNVIKLQPDGKILVGGYFYVPSVNMYGLVRLNSDGTLDTTFADGLSMPEGVYGGLFEDPRCIELQADGKILVGGSQWMAWEVQGGFDPIANNTQVGLIRLNSDGTLDDTFNIGNVFYNPYYGNGSATSVPSRIFGVKALSDGRILISGNFNVQWPVVPEGFNNTCNQLLMLNGDGTFNRNFRFSTSMDGCHVWGAHVQSDGKIIVFGTFGHYDNESSGGLVRINLNGTIDLSFAAHGFTKNGSRPTITCLSVSGDNVVVAGDFNYYVNKFYSSSNTQNNIALFTTLPIQKTAYQTLMEWSSDKDTIFYLIIESGHRDLTEEEQSQLDTLKAKCLAIDFDTLLCDAATDERLIGTQYESNRLTTEFPGITEINVLPSVETFNLLPATASVGDTILVESNGWYAWDVLNNEWSQSLYDNKIDYFLSTLRQTRDGKMNQRSYIEFAMRPFLFSALYIPSFQILLDTGGRIIKNFSKPISMDI